MRYFTVATAGHVDHGKTSLLKALTGVDPDRLKEEKERQMTTDLGFVHLTLPGPIGIGFIDVPGHGKFLKNMLAGVGGIDLCLFVVAADEGPMPQTEQHARILGLLGVDSAVLVLSKADLCEPESVARAQGEAAALLARSGLSVVSLNPISSTTGQGIAELKAALASHLGSLPEKSAGGRAFLPIDRVFVKAGFGTVVTGTLVRGRIRADDELTIEPGGIAARVRRLESLGETVEEAGPGQRLALNLVLRENQRLKRGQVLTGGLSPPASSLIVALAGGDSPRLAGSDVRLYHGTAEVPARIRYIRAVEPGLTLASIGLRGPLAALPHDRFVLRLADESIYGGTLLVLDPPRWLTREKAAGICASLQAQDWRSACLGYIDSCPLPQVHIPSLAHMVPPSLLDDVVSDLAASRRITVAGNFVLGSASLARLKAGIAGALAQEPRGISLEHMRAAVSPLAERPVFQCAVDEMVYAGLAARRGDKLVSAGEQGGDREVESVAPAVREILDGHFCLEIDEIARLGGLPPRLVRLAIESLADRGEAAIVAYDFAAVRWRLEKAHEELARIYAAAGDISPSAFKEGLGVSRKYAMALLAYFDDRQVTRRHGQGRTLLKRPEKGP